MATNTTAAAKGFDINWDALLTAVKGLKIPDIDWNLLLQYDTTTYVLVAAAAVLFVVYQNNRPQPLAHPLLFGRQSDVSKSRKQGESAVYRNYGLGHGSPLVARPKADVKTILDLVSESQTASRKLWKDPVTNAQLKHTAEALAAGLVKVTGLVPKESNVLFLMNDSIDFLVADLACAQLGITSFTTTTPSLVVPILQWHMPTAIIVSASYLDSLLEQIADEKESRLIYVIVVPEIGVRTDVTDLELKSGVKIFLWGEIEDAGKVADKIAPVEMAVDDVFSVNFYATSSDGHPVGAELTHQSLTAGVTAVMNLFPSGKSLTTSDTVISAFSLASPFGRAVAYAAVYNGAAFATVPSTALFKGPLDATKVGLEDLLHTVELYDLPAPTVAFITPPHLTSWGQGILNSVGLLFLWGWRHKISESAHGHISRDSWLDSFIFAGARKKIGKKLDEKLRQVVIGGEPIAPLRLRPSRLLLSVPVVNAYVHALVCGPVCATSPFDLQFFRTPSAHYGAPTAALELKLVGVDDIAVERGEDPVGEMVVRGPSILLTTPVKIPREDGWLKTGEAAVVQANGSIVLLPQE
ncbi:acetyl-CoA synthetase-like protein [Calocera viscosa TUFC12733]|uniref:Acetyl-CoA synthetase-like protein n=1 Tax=Calocera viscosa (strain TUFC12733) TaxID=1330018 RepID=A0A167L0G9_CALVF|nr:acetyl-CoA synthetase-like protein [Calocera viscosa TUFC12733]